MVLRPLVHKPFRRTLAIDDVELIHHVDLFLVVVVEIVALIVDLVLPVVRVMLRLVVLLLVLLRLVFVDVVKVHLRIGLVDVLVDFLVQLRELVVDEIHELHVVTLTPQTLS